MKRLSIVAPLYNEKDSIPILARTLSLLAERLTPEYELECILVDDGSRDGTSDEAKTCFASFPRLVLLKHERNRGPGAAVRTGFDKATGEVICTIDSDCTFDPLKIPSMLKLLDDQKADIVTASPYHPNGGVENVPPWRLLLSRGASAIYRRLCACKLYTYTSFMRAYRRQVIETVAFDNDGFAAFTEMLLRAGLQGYKVAEIPMVLKSRAAGTSKMKVVYTIRTHLALMARAFWWRISSPRTGSAALAKGRLALRKAVFSNNSKLSGSRSIDMNTYCESYAGKTVLVTGGAGAIGSNLCRELVRLGARVIVLDNLSSGHRWNVPSCQGVLFTEGDILDEVKLKRVFFEGPQIVYHLAAFFANQNSLDHPERDLMVNGMGTLRLLEYSLLTGVERFVFASSGCAVYDGAAPLPLNEDYMSMNLTTPYQVTKMLGELYCNFFYNHYALKVVKTRFFNSYGAGEVPGQYRNVIPNFIYYAMKGLPLPITGEGEETRDFTYVGDTVDGLLRAGVMEEAIGKEFNLATCRETRIGDLAHMINRLVGNKAGVLPASRRKWDNHSRRLASIDRAKDLLGYNPQTPLEVGLRYTIDWFVENWDKIEAAASFAPGMSSAVREMVVNQEEKPFTAAKRVGAD